MSGDLTTMARTLMTVDPLKAAGKVIVIRTLSGHTYWATMAASACRDRDDSSRTYYVSVTSNDTDGTDKHMCESPISCWIGRIRVGSPLEMGTGYLYNGPRLKTTHTSIVTSVMVI